MVRLGHVGAQQPAYFILGEEQFKGLQVYDVIQDGQDNYLFSTNEGLFYYDFLHFEPLGCDQAKSAAMFNFVADSAGTIYCSNLNHQIFKIQDKACSLFYTLLPDEDSPDLSLILSPAGELLACSKKIIRLSASGKVLGRWDAETTGWGRPFMMPSGKIILHFPKTDSILQYDQGCFSMHQLVGAPQPHAEGALFSFFAVAGQMYAVDLARSSVWRLEDSGFSMQLLPAKYMMDRSEPLRFYTTGTTTWVGGSLLGVVGLRGPLERVAPQLYYTHYFISDVFQDREGNLLLSTFDHGILVIPNLDIPDVIDPFADEPITALHIDHQSGSLYLGTTRGNLLQFQDGALRPLVQDGKRPIEGLFGSASSNRLIFQGGVEIMYWDPEAGKVSLGVTAALKDAVFVEPDVAFLATSRGIFRCAWHSGKPPVVTPWPGFDFRIHHMVQDRPGNALVASTSRGLYYIPLQGKARRIDLGGADLFPTAMYAADGKVFAASQPHGILVLEKGRVAARIVPEIGRSEAISKLVVDKARMFAKSSHGIYQLGMDGRMQRNIGKAFGFLKSRVFDFELDGYRMWVSHAGGVQAIDLSFSAVKQVPPQLRLVQVSVNDKNVAPTVPGEWASDERKIRFDLAFPSLRNRETLRIHYQLQGYENTWQLKLDDEFAIVYNALEPGNYTFRAKAENQGQFSQPVSYSFSIAAPLYRRWWFMALVLVLMAGGVGAVYRRQMLLQGRKAKQINELNASKLAAIQSQMNPHFIFNAMNSIQDLILKGDIENSYSYVTTFSNLVRSTLKYSERDFIDFEQELELLGLYLSLEKLRFEDDLDYTITNLVEDDIQLPPLLIQPFVENALLHGLLHKAGLKKLLIRFELNAALTCTIEDNGIGRQRAMEIRARQRGEHESFSGKAIRKRFDILSDVHQGEFGYVQEDIMLHGQVVGTRTILQIPVRRRF